MQAGGTQEVDSNLDSFVLVKQEGDSHQRLVFLDLEPADNSLHLSLCMCTIRILYHLLHIRLLVRDLQTWKLPNVTHRSQFSRGLIKVVELLSREKPVALTQATGVLEFMLWGPEDRLMRDPRNHEDEANLRLWLELERARKVNFLARSVVSDTQAPLGVFSEHHVIFLVRGTVKKLLESHSLLNLS